jgi:hypothetical protein
MRFLVVAQKSLSCGPNGCTPKVWRVLLLEDTVFSFSFTFDLRWKLSQSIDMENWYSHRCGTRKW